MLKAYDFSGFGMLADVGGGNGSLLSAVLARITKLQGDARRSARRHSPGAERLTAAGVVDRCQLVGGEFLSGDTGRRRRLFDAAHHPRLGRCEVDADSQKHPPGPARPWPGAVGRGIVEPGNAPSFAKSLDLTMLIMPGGKERTIVEYEQLFKTAGLRLTASCRPRVTSA